MYRPSTLLWYVGRRKASMKSPPPPRTNPNRVPRGQDRKVPHEGDPRSWPSAMIFGPRHPRCPPGHLQVSNIVPYRVLGKTNRKVAPHQHSKCRGLVPSCGMWVRQHASACYPRSARAAALTPLHLRHRRDALRASLPDRPPKGGSMMRRAEVLRTLCPIIR